MESTFFDVEVTCALCGEVFDAREMTGFEPAAAQDTELRTYSPVDPWKHLLHTCPACGFTDYDHHVDLDDTVKTRIRAYLTMYCRDQDPDAFVPWQQFEVLAEMSRLIGKPSSEVGKAYLRAAWMADDDRDDDRATSFRKQAIELFVQSLEKGEAPPGETPFIVYMVAELKRRTGEFDEALEWFKKIPRGSQEFERIREHQIALARAGESCLIQLPRGSGGIMT
jgi:hypothetical protein